MWRMWLESLMHEENAFVTLTYSDEHLPRGNTLVPAHLSGFLKRVRKRIEPSRIRFFGVGEYGNGGLRGVNPHYHLSLFGLSGRTVELGRNRFRHYGCSELLWDCWQSKDTGGNVFTAEFNETTAQYTAGYVVKKLTAKDNPLLEGRHPEFARMSNRPGIGAGAAELIAQRLLERHLDWSTGDVPHELKVGSRTIPLGRYLLRKLRQHVGFSEVYIKEIRDKVSHEESVEMSALLQAALLTSPSATPRQVYLERMLQRIRNTEARALLYKKREAII